jgi:hypothetical protein
VGKINENKSGNRNMIPIAIGTGNEIRNPK